MKIAYNPITAKAVITAATAVNDDILFDLKAKKIWAKGLRMGADWADISSKPSSLKNPAAIKFRDINGNEVSYDGSVAKNLTTGTYIARLPYGFSSWKDGVTWGNTTGTSIASWYDSSGGSIDFRKDNPSSGKLSIKVDGRVYVNEGANPVLSSESNHGFWGMRTPDGGDDWIRTSNNGLLPCIQGNAGSGHSSLGTNSWYFSTAYIDKVYGSLKGNADTATTATTALKADKLTNARNIALGTDLRGSANFDGSGNITINATINSCSVSVGGTDKLHFKRIAHFETAYSCNDSALLLYISQGYINGNNGICRVEFRTDDISKNSTSVTASAAVRWLVRNGYGLDSLYAGYYVTTDKAYIDIYLKTTGGYQGTVIRVLQDRRGSIDSKVQLISAKYHSDTDYKEAYSSIEVAATTLYNKAYTKIISGSDVGIVNYANNAYKWTTARTFTIGNTAKDVDGSGNVSWSLSEIGVRDTWRTVQVNGTSIGNNTLNLCGSTYIGLTNVNGKVAFSLVGSGTTANQAILSNGTANGWTLKTLNIANWDTAYNLRHSHANKSVLDGITSGLVTNWNTAYTFVSTITGKDTDDVINKWDEIVNFLTGIKDDNKLNTLLSSKLSIQQLSAEEVLTTKTNNALFWVNTIGTAGSITTGPFTDHPYALLSVTNYNQNAENNKYFYRSRLAFSSAGDLKVASCHHQNEYKQDDAWYNVLTSKNSGIEGSTIKLNGTSITVYNSGTADGRYVKKSGDTMTGTLNINTAGFGALHITRNNDVDAASIQFGGKSSVYGYIGFNVNAKNKQLLRWSPDIAGPYTILDTSTTNVTNGKGIINGTTITQVDNADTVDGEHASNFSYTHQSSFDFGTTKSGRIVTFDQPTNDYSWINGFASTHANYLTSVLFNVHRTSRWYVGYIERKSSKTNETNGLQAVHQLAFVDQIPTSLKNPHALTISLNGTSQGPYDGSTAKNINITPGSIGAAPSQHTHNYLVVNAADNTSFNSAYSNFQVLYAGGGNGITGKPDGVNAFGLFRFRVAGGWSGQMLFANGGSLYIRSAVSANFNNKLAWRQIIDSTTIGQQSVKYATSAGSATKVIVNQFTAGDADYPLVWSNQSNTSNVTENQLYKSWQDLYYNPKNKRLFVGGSVSTANINATGTVTSAGFKHSAVTKNANQYVLTADGGYTFLNQTSNELEREFSKDITVTSEWTDIEDFYGGSQTFLTQPGTYVVQVYYTTNSANSMYEGYFSGIMSWYTGTTNSNNADEIVLHRVGHAYANTIYLRTIESPKDDTHPYTKLQISANSDLKQHTYKFKFKRIC